MLLIDIDNTWSRYYIGGGGRVHEVSEPQLFD
jgi:hypothetical protein